MLSQINEQALTHVICVFFNISHASIWNTSQLIQSESDDPSLCDRCAQSGRWVTGGIPDNDEEYDVSFVFVSEISPERKRANSAESSRKYRLNLRLANTPDGKEKRDRARIKTRMRLVSASLCRTEFSGIKRLLANDGSSLGALQNIK